MLDLVGYLVPLSQVSGVGTSVLSGTVAPADTLGADGNYYIDTTTNTLYGPKTGGTWAPRYLKGGVIALRTASNGNLGLAVALVAADPVAFPTDGAVVGTNISRVNDTTFGVAAAGTYRITYRLTTVAATVAGSGVHISINGTATTPVNLVPAGLASAGATITDTVPLALPAGATIQIVVDGAAGITLNTGNSATIDVEQVA